MELKLGELLGLHRTSFGSDHYVGSLIVHLSARQSGIVLLVAILLDTR